MRLFTIFTLSAALLGNHLCGQIKQIHPELCGKKDGFVSLPPGVAVTGSIAGQGELFLGEGSSATKVSLPGLVGEMEQVCPVSNGRLVLFASTFNSTNVTIVDAAKKVVLDFLHGFDPTLSPDQRWLVYRKFYPKHTDSLPSDEYLLYDMSKTPKENRAPGVGLEEWSDVGVAIFPPGMKNESFDNLDVPQEFHHAAHSSPFWGSDSRAIVFDDFFQNRFAVIVVTIDGQGATKAYKYPIRVSDVCPSTTRTDLDFRLAIGNADVGPDLLGDRSIRVTLNPIGEACEPKPLELSLEEFKPSRPDVYVKPVPKRKGAIIINQ